MKAPDQPSLRRCLGYVTAQIPDRGNPGDAILLRKDTYNGILLQKIRGPNLSKHGRQKSCSRRPG